MGATLGLIVIDLFTRSRGKAADGLLGRCLLKLPLNFAFESEKTMLQGHFDLILRNQNISPESVLCRQGDVAVSAFRVPGIFTSRSTAIAFTPGNSFTT